MMNLVGTAIRQKVASSTKTLLALALVLAMLLAASVPALAQTEPKTEPRAGQEEEAQQQKEAGPQPEQKEGQQPGSEAEPKAGPETEEPQTEEPQTEEPQTEEPQTEEAQPGEVSATGRIGRLADYPGATHGINDEATGAFHALRSDTVDLDAYADSGQRVTVYGTQRQTLVAEKNPVLDVVRVVPADVEDPGGDEDDEATLSFELTVDGDPPAGAAFYGNVKTGEGGPGLFVPLADPDGDRVYTGSTTVDRFGPGPRPVPPGVEPVSLPVRIVQDYTEEVIKDFGAVKLDEDKTFSASVSFPVDDCPIISPTPEQCGDGASGGSGSGAGSGGGGSSDGGSSGGNGGSGAVGGGSGSGGSSSGSGVPVGMANGLRGVLPSTGGGTALWVLGAGALLAGGGFLIRRLAS